MLDHTFIDNRGRVWNYDKDSREYYVKEGIPLMDPSQGIIHGLALTADGYLCKPETGKIYKNLPLLKEFIFRNVIALAITREDQLIRINLRTESVRILAENIIHLIGYASRSKTIDVINKEGHLVKLSTTDRFREVVKIKVKEYLSKEIISRQNNFLITSDGCFLITYEDCRLIIYELNYQPSSKIASIIESSYILEDDEGYQYSILILDDEGNLFTGHRDDYELDSDFHPCTNQFIIEANQADQWVKLIRYNFREYVGLVSRSGAISLIGRDLSIKSTDLPTEIYRQ